MDNNFDIDTGIDLDYPMELEQYKESDSEEQIKGDKSIRGVAIISIIVGILVIIAAFGMIGIASKIQGKVEDKKVVGNNLVSGVGSEDVGSEDVGSEMESITPEISIPERVRDSMGEDTGDEPEWVIFKQDDKIEFDKEIEALFTVTSIQHVAKVVNNKNDKIIKSIVKGNISGITGNYEIDIPYDKAKLISDGTVFNVRYKYNMRNDVRIIGEIKY